MDPNIKKVFFTTVHPAPYINNWFEVLSAHFDLEPLYYFKTWADKPWKTIPIYPGQYAEDHSWFTWAKKVIASDIAIIGGGDQFQAQHHSIDHLPIMA